MNIKAMILAAGMGTRLRPLTDTTPKALLKFRGRTMLEHVVDHLVANGIKEVVINIHHHADQVRNFLEAHRYFGIKFYVSDESDQLMDTGGGMVRAQKYLEGDGPFIVHNVDIFSDTDFSELQHYHAGHEALATLAVSERETSRNLLVDAAGLLCGWRNNITGEEIIARKQDGLRPVAFSGIHMVEPRIFSLFDREEREKPFSITKAYLELAAQHRIMTFDHTGDTWIDMASPLNFPNL